MERILENPSEQYAQIARLRDALGPADALQRSARFAVALAKTGHA
jgi:hypothetical protein